MMDLSVKARLRMVAKGFRVNGEFATARVMIELAEQLDSEYKQKEDRIKKLEFMIDNGLGWEDMKGGNIEDVK